MITFFLNKEKDTYFLVDPIKRTLNYIGQDYWTFYHYSHLVPQRVVTIPDYSTLCKLRKTILASDLLTNTPPEQVAQAILDNYPEYFL